MTKTGITLKEYMKERGMTALEVAGKSGLPVQIVEGILGGAVTIGPDASMRLSNAFGTSDTFWFKLDASQRSVKEV